MEHYMIIATLAAISLGCLNFMLDLANREGQSGMRIVYLMGSGSWVFALVYHMIDVCKHKQIYGIWWSKEQSPYFNNGLFDWYLGMFVALRAVLNVARVVIGNMAIEKIVNAGVQPSMI